MRAKVVIWKRMNISADLFQAHLKCPMKCWLCAAGEIATGNAYAEWVKTQDEAYRTTETARLQGDQSNVEMATSPGPENLKSAKWKLATNVMVQALVNSWTAESNLHAVERVPSAGRGQAAQFIPIRFIWRNKLTKDDKLLLAYDSSVLSQSLGREVSQGKIIHGDDHATLKVKISSLAGEVRKHAEKIAALLTSEKPPDLVLNRHCAECEFQARCRKIAVEKDDLSLLAGMSAKERQELRGKGIFNVTQLSYTFLPRRRPKRLRDKREKYHHSLKALAIRERKIHIVGSPELKIEGTPVYLDVEGLPDRDFYYLIGLRIGHGDSAVQHSLWADTVVDEGKIWREFLAILETVEKPALIHYGNYETDFLEVMGIRYGDLAEQAAAKSKDRTTVNVLSAVLGQVYFPTYSNSLKDVGAYLGFSWFEGAPIGVKSVACRCEWEQTKDPAIKARLVAYNAADCQAAEVVTQALLRLKAPETWTGSSRSQSGDAVLVESLRGTERKIGNFVSPFAEFEQINLAAWWNYQRDRIYVRSSKRKRGQKEHFPQDRRNWKSHIKVNKLVICAELTSCPYCGGACKARTRCTRMIYDLSFGRSCVKRWVVEYQFRRYWCPSCQSGANPS